MQAAKIDALNSPALNSMKAYCPNGLSPSAASAASLNLARPHAVDRAGAGHDDEERDHRRHDAADDHLDARLGVLLRGDPFSTTAACR